MEQDRTGQDSRGQSRTGQEKTGQGKAGGDGRTRQGGTGQDWKEQRGTGRGRAGQSKRTGTASAVTFTTCVTRSANASPQKLRPTSENVATKRKILN
jgi:hypothetical protein